MRLRVQFSLRFIFLLIAAVAVWLAWNVKLVHDRNEFIRLHSFGLGNGLFPFDLQKMPQKPLPLGWSFLGAKPMHHIHVSNAWIPDGPELAKVQRMFPDAYIIRDREVLGY